LNCECHTADALSCPHLHESELLLLPYGPDPAPHFNLLLLLTSLTTAGLHLLLTGGGGGSSNVDNEQQNVTLLLALN
jgi:hypothetical protein